MSKPDHDKGTFVISLDFELHWGVWDVLTKEKYGPHIVGVKKVIPALLSLFEQYDFKVTFSTVGFLFARNRDELLSFIPEIRPGYLDERYDVYARELPSIGCDENDDPYHFGYSLFEMIQGSPHEIGTHTFSHYYCLEEGQSAVEFDADIKAAKKIAALRGIRPTSIVFPRNQLNMAYLDTLRKNDIFVYRGNPTSWIYKPRKFSAEIPFIRLCRLLDTYLPISGYNTHKIEAVRGEPVNIPASHFLKPYNNTFPFFEKLKLQRIKTEMTKAAQRAELFHLWWHPHNFGMHTDKNMANLRELLDHFQQLNKQYGFRNLTMTETANDALAVK